MSVLVVLEQREGKWNRQSFEALAAARKISDALGSPLEAAVSGANVRDLAAKLVRMASRRYTPSKMLFWVSTRQTAIQRHWSS